MRSAPAWKFKPRFWSNCSINQCWSPSPPTPHDDLQNQSIPERQSWAPARESEIFCSCPAAASSASSTKWFETTVIFSIDSSPLVRDSFRDWQFRAVFLFRCSWECASRGQSFPHFRLRLVPLKLAASPCSTAQQSLPEVWRFTIPFGCFEQSAQPHVHCAVSWEQISCCWGHRSWH